MKQLIQNFKSGDLYIDDLPVPSVSEGFVLVANKFSLISAGTERSTVSTAQASILGKAKKRPDLVKQVLQNYKKEGLKATIEKVQTKLDSLKALGYSSAGVVLPSMDSENRFKPGDLVACAGQDYASHAEVVSVPQNLVAKIPEGVALEDASYTTLGAIALQGVRQADPTLGENICVIGLGLLGQITCQILKANGCNVFGIDVSTPMVELTNETDTASAMVRSDPNLMAGCDNFTNGHGFDKVIITAAGPTNDPIELSGQISAKKGVVVMVGAVKMDIPRDPDYYRKEIELRMSCSYGPGRYDVNYEEMGQDYPMGYVRWTEQRNMEAFLKLIARGSVKLKHLTTHTFMIEKAVEAYDLVLGKNKEPFVGILIQYDVSEDSRKGIVQVKSGPKSHLNMGFIGAGSFAQSYLIPAAQSLGSLDTVVTRNGMNAKNVAHKFGFNNASSDPRSVIGSDEINVAFIATQHDTHASFTIQALEKGKAVFVEKPLAMNMEELEAVNQAYQQLKEPSLMVGYNRRFADVSLKAKETFSGIGEPLVMNFRVNAGFIPKDHWTQTAAGGGRIIGEICHFVDLMQFITGADPVRVFAECIDTSSTTLKNDDNIGIVIKFSDGSVGNLVYTANGDKSLSKERFEISGGNVVFLIDDFRKGILYRDNRETVLKNSGKGHRQEVEAFLKVAKDGGEMPISFRSLYLTSLTTIKIIDALASGLPQDVHKTIQ